MSDNNQVRWQPQYFNGDLCRYLSISPHRQHYKSFILKKLKQTMKPKYGRWEIDESLLKILKDNDLYVSWYKTASNAELSRYVSRLRTHTPSNGTFMVLQIYEEGEPLQMLTV